MKQTRRASQRCDGFHLSMRLDIVERIANGGASRSCEPTRGEQGQGQRGRCGRLRRGGLRPYVFLGTQVLCMVHGDVTVTQIARSQNPIENMDSRVRVRAVASRRLLVALLSAFSLAIMLVVVQPDQRVEEAPYRPI